MEGKDTTILSFSQIFLVGFLNKKMFYFFAFFLAYVGKYS